MIRRLFSAVVLLALLVAVPVLLITWNPWQIPQSWPGPAETALGHKPPYDIILIDVAVVLLWSWWAMTAYVVIAKIASVVLRMRLPIPRLAVPLHSAVTYVVGASVITAAPAAAAASTVVAAPHTDDTLANRETPRQDAVAGPSTPGLYDTPVTISVGSQRYVHIVRKGEYLSKIAKTWLGDADRWPEICALNKHRHFPTVGGTLHDCNLIYPGWDLRLPADARPPHDATPATPPDQPVQTPPTTTPSQTPQATPSPSMTPSITASAANPVIPPTAAPSLTAAPAASAAPSAAPQTDEYGVQLPDGSWIPWALAVAISAAAAMVWLQRRRRYTGEPDDDPPTELPPPVTQLRRAVARNPELPTMADDAAQAVEVPALAPLPPGGIGLRGDGAHAAARAALVAVLASGGPHHPHARGEVVIDAATLATLIGSDAVAPGPWPRLHIADDIDDALTIIEARLLHRSRILDEHALTDLDTLRERAPDEEALPPILLVCETPAPRARMRAKVSLALGSGLHVSALLLGEWAHGATVEVAADGHTRLLAGQSSEPVPARLPVLAADPAVQILITLREAHTGAPPADTSAAFPGKPVPLNASRTTPSAEAPADDTPPVPASAAAGGETAKARLRVIGPPSIQDITEPGRPLRAKALELAVFLACHPDGAATRDIGEYLEPDARISQADQRVHTNASNLRHVLARAAGGRKSGYVVKAAGRYRLDPATVEIDVWQLRDLMRTATIATGERRRTLLQAACDLYTAPLAEGHDYEWLQPHREAVRRWGTEAHLLLADDLLDTDPQAASDLLDKAIGLDRYNEQLYRKAIHARHTLGDAEGIRTLTRALTKSLADLDAEPQEETITLATQLRASLEHR